MKALNEQYKYKIENVHISMIQVGDTILHTDGLLRTVCHNNVKRDPFMGLSLFGDSYKLGTMSVKRVKFVLNDK